MKANEGNIDRILRVVVGLVLLLLTPQIGGLIGNPLGISTVWAWIGVVPLLTGIIGWCPAYTIFGINTCSVKSAR